MNQRTESCKTCIFAADEAGYQVHQCRRRAPATKIVEPSHDLRQHVPVWPIVRSDDWCGDYLVAPVQAGAIRPLPGEQVQVERRRFPESGME